MSLKQGHKTFPVVVNMVVYHGNKPWNYSTAFADYYAHPALGAQHLYMAPFTLINLPELAAEELYKDRALGFCFAAFHVLVAQILIKPLPDRYKPPSSESTLQASQPRIGT